jgi:hypothetical protein
MLRRVLLALAGALVVAGLLLHGADHPGPGTALLLGGLVLGAGLLVERWRYRTETDHPDPSWQRTGERFTVPGRPGGTVEVYDDPATGERHYVRVPERGSRP